MTKQFLKLFFLIILSFKIYPINTFASPLFDEKLKEISFLVVYEKDIGKSIEAEITLKETIKNWKTLSFIDRLELKREFTSNVVVQKLNELETIAKNEGINIVEELNFYRYNNYERNPSPLIFFATGYNLIEVVKTLVKLGVDPNPNIKLSEDYSLIDYATINHRTEITKFLIESSQIDVTKTDGLGKPPLYWATLGDINKDSIKKCKGGSAKITEFLIQIGAPLDPLMALCASELQFDSRNNSINNYAIFFEVAKTLHKTGKSIMR